MRQLHKYSPIFFILIALIVFSTSCKKFVEIDPPSTQIQTNEIFSNDQTALSALTGLYTQMISTSMILSNGGVSLYTGLTSDELYNTSSSSDLDTYKNNSISTLGSISTRFWSPAYRFIYHANALLEGLQRSTGMSDSITKQVRGEALLVRSFIYFNLVNLFGDIPLILSTDYRINAVMPRNAAESVYQQIILDLLEAQLLLPSTYPTSGRVRPNKSSVTALLARVYLYHKEWAKAAEQATKVINNSSVYQLVPSASIGQTFRSNSAEAIWQLMPVSTSLNTAEGNAFIPSSATVIPTYALTTFLIQAFEIGDKRKTSWVSSNSIGAPATVYYYPYKYQTRTTPAGNENYILLRLAEQYLIRAEARAQLGLITEAKNDLNIIRSRAGLAASTVTDQSLLLTAIEHERQVELFAEWGNRWYDLKRNRRADTVLGIAKFPNWQSTDALFPIPQAELDRNPLLIQNPGY